MKSKCQVNKCLNCSKSFKIKAVNRFIYLCPVCYGKYKQLPKDDKSKLKLIGKCQEMGIIYVAS